MKNEEWKPVKDWEGIWEVSSRGRVRSVRTQRVRSLFDHPGGYKMIRLYRGSRSLYKYVHRLVLFAFVGDPPPSPGVKIVTRHLNGDPTDNRLENLKWGTCSENAKDAVAHGSGIGTSKLVADQVREIRSLYIAGDVLQKELADQFGVSSSVICLIVNRKIWKHVD